MHLDLDLAGFDGSGRPDLPAERVETSGMAAPQRQDVGGIGQSRRKTMAHPQHVPAFGCPDNLLFSAGGRQFGSDLAGAIIRRQGCRQIEQAQREPWHLVGEHARKTPYSATNET